MLRKGREAVLFSGLLLTVQTCFAVPSLKLHVFNQSQVNQQTVPPLKLHIFDGQSQNQPQSAEKKAQKVIERKTFRHEKAEFYVKTGIQHDEHRWTISGLTGTPNILSELIWQNIRIAKIDTGVKLHFHDSWLFNLDLGYGRIYNGDNQDSDYLGNNRTFEFSRSNNAADEGDVYDFSLSVGKTWDINAINMQLTPLIGYGYRAQNLRMTDGYQTVSNYGFSMPLGPISGLDSSYDASWQGPWLGLDALFSLNSKVLLNFGAELHYTFYNAVGTWNLRSDLAQPKSFTNEAEGVGVVLKLGAEYRLSDKLVATFSAEKESWDADRNGEKTTYGSDSTVLTGQPFNDAERESFLLNLGLNYSF